MMAQPSWGAGGVAMGPMAPSVHLARCGSPAPSCAGRAVSPDGGGQRTAFGKIESDVNSVGTWPKDQRTVAAGSSFEFGRRAASPEVSRKRTAFYKVESGTWLRDLRTAATKSFGRLHLTDRSDPECRDAVLKAIVNGKANDRRPMPTTATGAGKDTAPRRPCWIVKRDHARKTLFQVPVAGARVLAQKVALACCKQNMCRFERSAAHLMDFTFPPATPFGNPLQVPDRSLTLA